MAGRAQPVGRGTFWAGVAAAALVALVVAGSLLAVALRAEGTIRVGPADWAAIRFTLWQAVWSAAISVTLAIPVARALARQQFPGRQFVITLLGAPFILPVIVAVFGLLAIFGRAGLLSQLIGLFGLPPVQVYGLHGVVLAHVFLNLPLAARLILQGWLSIPGERYRLAASLGFGPREMRRHFEGHVLRQVLPGAFMLIFLITTTSFAVALALGGGPRATTVELAIYQAFRFDFDLGRAAILALVQLSISVFAVAAVIFVALPDAMGAGLGRPIRRWDGARCRVLDAGVIALAVLFLGLPILMIALDGIQALPDLGASVWWAALRSIGVALASAGLVILLALAIALAARGRRWVEALGYLAITASPLVLGTGLFLILFPIADPVALAMPVTVLVNAIMALPFALRALAPAVAEAEARYGRIADQIGMQGWVRIRRLILPQCRRALGFAAGLAAALSMGDLGVIALFADPDAATLPLQMYRLMAAYRLDQAAGAAVLLVALTFGIFWLFDRGGRAHADV